MFNTKSNTKQPWRDKSVVITGGSSGIGLAFGSALADQGARVWLLARDPVKLAAAAAQIAAETGSQPETRSVDVSNMDAVAAVFEEIGAKDGVPAMVINSAGITRPTYFQEIPIDTFRRIMEVNYLGVVHTTRAVLPAMRSRGWGHIVGISSTSGLIGALGYTAYGASKFALRGLFDALRVEIEPEGVRVHLICPPDVDTPMLEEENKYKPELVKELSANVAVTSPEAVAAAGLAGIKRGKYYIIPGMDNKLAYFVSLLPMDAPYYIQRWFIRRAQRKLEAQKTKER